VSTRSAASGTEVAAQLRREFDLGFRQPAAGAVQRLEGVLAIRVGGESVAIRIAEIAGVYADRRIVALPSLASELLGVANFRGVLAPVYDLAALLGYPASDTPRWLLVARGQKSVAFAFEAFEGQRMVSPESVIAGDIGIDVRLNHQQLHDAVRIDGRVRPVVNLALVLEQVQRKVESRQVTRP